jgi:uncharacterized protein YeeX (DUF496 family)
MVGRKKMSHKGMYEFIHSLRGKYKMRRDKPFAESMAELNREEKELEERKFQRLIPLGKGHRLS